MPGGAMVGVEATMKRASVAMAVVWALSAGCAEVGDSEERGVETNEAEPPSAGRVAAFTRHEGEGAAPPVRRGPTYGSWAHAADVGLFCDRHTSDAIGRG